MLHTSRLTPESDATFSLARILIRINLIVGFSNRTHVKSEAQEDECLNVELLLNFFFFLLNDSRRSESESLRSYAITH